MRLVYAETERLVLRGHEDRDIPYVVEYLGDWNVARWQVNTPSPYRRQDAEEFFSKMTDARHRGTPEYFVIEEKRNDQLVGAIGLHPSREPHPKGHEFVVGYWLGKPFWGLGYMTEAVKSVCVLAFARPHLSSVLATTDVLNEASQNVLRKAGFAFLGIHPRAIHESGLRGSDQVTRWELRRGAA